MPGNADAIRRSEQELHAATRPFEEVSVRVSWWHLGSTFALLLVSLGLATVMPWWPLRAAMALLAGLLLVRAFIVFHDTLHHAIVRGSVAARALVYLYGLAVLAPPRGWRHTHNFHHAHVGKPIRPQGEPSLLMTYDLGSFPLMSTDAWNRASTFERLRYRISRHPLTMLCAYMTVFLLNLCLLPFLRDPRKNWDCGLSIALHVALIVIVWTGFGFAGVAFAIFIPATIASALGAYLFFVQHNYPGMRIVPLGEWTHCRGALESSSYLKCGWIMRWFTGNIGYHHVHHLNALIPFYRLPEAMAAVPELRHPVATSFHPRDVLHCLRLNLWDTTRQQLVSYREAAATVTR